LHCSLDFPGTSGSFQVGVFVTYVLWRALCQLDYGEYAMCDYSLQKVKSRDARIGDQLTARNFGTGTRGFASLSDSTPTAVCVRPGTEIAFQQDVRVITGLIAQEMRTMKTRTATFRQVNKEQPHVHHDALEFVEDGATVLVLLHHLDEHQHAVILQLPAAPKTEAEAKAQQRLEVVG
jgi:hypothetical protein